MSNEPLLGPFFLRTLLFAVQWGEGVPRLPMEMAIPQVMERPRLIPGDGVPKQARPAKEKEHTELQEVLVKHQLARCRLSTVCPSFSSLQFLIVCLWIR